MLDKPARRDLLGLWRARRHNDVEILKAVFRDPNAIGARRQAERRHKDKQ
jgi:hypothetical protein